MKIIGEIVNSLSLLFAVLFIFSAATDIYHIPFWFIAVGLGILLAAGISLDIYEKKRKTEKNTSFDRENQR